MRILIVSQYFFPELGATGTCMRQYARQLCSMGHQVVVLTEFPNHPRGIIPSEYRGRFTQWDQLDGFEVLRVWVKTARRKNFRTRLAFYVSFMVMSVIAALKIPGRFDVVLATSPPLTVGMSGWLIAKMKRARLLLDVRDLWPDAAVGMGELSDPRLIKLAERIERALYRHAAAITTVTEGFADHIKRFCGDAAKVHLIPNGTLTSVFNPGRVDPQLRRRLALEDKFVCTFAGTLGIAQGLHFVLDLAADMRDEPDVHFVIIGDGPVRDALAQRQRDESLDNVTLLDPVPMDEVTPYLTMSDVLLVPLRKDPVFRTFIPSKLYDCLACRKAVVLGVAGEARALLEKHGGGIAVEPESISSYRQAILTLKRDPALRERMANEGFAWVTAGYSREKQSAILGTIVESLG